MNHKKYDTVENNISDTSHYENVPIEVPASWSIIPLEYLATFSGGKTPSMDNKEYWNNGKHLWVTSKDMKSVHITDSLMKISDSALEQMNIYPKGTLLLVTRSGILRHTLPIAILGDEATVNQDIKTISCHFPNINRYLYYAIKAQEQVILEQYHKDGTTVDSIDFDKFKKLPIPLPPIEEQSRIIAEINRLFALVDTIENNQTDLESTIAQTKSKILDLAIHGKLVPQDPNDEPASELLKRINPAAEITCDNGHYQKLPKGWAKCKLSNLCKIENGYAFSSSDYKQSGTPLVRISNITNNIIDLSECVFVQDIVVDEKFKISQGDLLIAMSGATTGKMGIYTYKETAYLNQRVGNIRILDTSILLPLYRDCFMQSKVEEILKLAYGGAQPNISASVIGDFEFLLPPINEQKRIVEAIDITFKHFDAIMESL